MKNFKKVFISLVVCLSMLLSLAACGETKTYTVTFDCGVEAQTVDEGKTATKPTDPTKAGDDEWTSYTFDGWFLDDATEAFDFTTAITADISLKAKFTGVGKKSYDVTFGGMKGIDKQTIEYGAKVTEPAAEKIAKKDGYKFLGWYNGDNKFDFESETVSGVLALKPKYEKIKANFDDELPQPTSYNVPEEKPLFGGDPTVSTDEGTEGASKFVGVATSTVKSNKELPYYNGFVLFDTSKNPEFLSIEPNYLTFDVRFTYVAGATEDDVPVAFTYFAISDSTYSLESEIYIGEYSSYNTESNVKIYDKNGTLFDPVTTNYDIEYDTWYTVVVPYYTGEDGNDCTVVFKEMSSEEVGAVAYVKNFEAYVADPFEADYDGINRFNVTFIGGGEIPVQTVAEDQTAIKPADPTNPKGPFLGWFKEGATEAFDFTTPITEDVSLIAKFELPAALAVDPFVYDSADATLETSTDDGFTDALKYTAADPGYSDGIFFINSNHSDIVDDGYKFLSVKMYFTVDGSVRFVSDFDDMDEKFGIAADADNWSNEYVVKVFDEDGNQIDFAPSDSTSTALVSGKWYTFVVPIEYEAGTTVSWQEYYIRLEKHWSVDDDFVAYLKEAKVWFAEPTAQDLGFTATEPQA